MHLITTVRTSLATIPWRKVLGEFTQALLAVAQVLGLGVLGLFILVAIGSTLARGQRMPRTEATQACEQLLSEAMAQPAPRAAPADISSQSTRIPARQVTLTAGAIAKWLSPATLRQQFILTEILQPPLALRAGR